MKTSTFAKRLKEAMELRRISQTELSEITHIGKSSISTYLKGDYKAKQDKVDILARALSVSPVWLMGYDTTMYREEIQADNYHEDPQQDTSTDEEMYYYDDPKVNEMAERIRTSGNTRLLFDATKDMTEDDIDFVVKLIEKLKKND